MIENNISIEIIKKDEICEVSKLIAKTTRISLAPYYPQSTIDEVINSLDPAGVEKRASWTHFYVVKLDNKIVGCGAIGPYWDSTTESSLFTIFVDPDCQRQGIGRKIIQALEQDEYFKRAKRIEIPAAMNALPFYRKMGYEHKNGILNFSDGHFALEKFNNI